MKSVVQILAATAALSALLACARKPVGEYEPEPGFDGPDLPYEPEVVEGSGTAAAGVDSDGDGLSDAEEEELGLDPDRVDSDGDGFDDGVELAENADPTDPTHHPYAGGYGIDACWADIQPTGDAVGQVTNDFALMDQHGEDVRLHDFCGRQVLLVTSAMWCAPCQDEAPHLQDLYDTYAAQGFVVMTLLGENEYGETPSLSDLQRWADEFGLNHPVLADPSYGVSARWAGVYIPTMHLVGPGAEVLMADTYVDETTIEANLP